MLVSAVNGLGRVRESAVRHERVKIGQFPARSRPPARYAIIDFTHGCEAMGLVSGGRLLRHASPPAEASPAAVPDAPRQSLSVPKPFVDLAEIFADLIRKTDPLRDPLRHLAWPRGWEHSTASPAVKPMSDKGDPRSDAWAEFMPVFASGKMALMARMIVSASFRLLPMSMR